MLAPTQVEYIKVVATWAQYDPPKKEDKETEELLQKGTYIVICNGYYIEYIFSGPDCNITVSLNPAPSINDTRPITPEETDPGTNAGILIVCICSVILCFVLFYRRYTIRQRVLADMYI